MVYSAWIHGSLDPTRLDLKVLKVFKQMTVFLAWIPGSMDPTRLGLQTLKVFKQMTFFLTWIPGSHKARFVNFNGFQTNSCLFVLDPWIRLASIFSL